MNILSSQFVQQGEIWTNNGSRRWFLRVTVGRFGSCFVQGVCELSDNWFPCSAAKFSNLRPYLSNKLKRLLGQVFHVDHFCLRGIGCAAVIFQPRSLIFALVLRGAVPTQLGWQIARSARHKTMYCSACQNGEHQLLLRGSHWVHPRHSSFDSTRQLKRDTKSRTDVYSNIIRSRENTVESFGRTSEFLSPKYSPVNIRFSLPSFTSYLCSWCLCLVCLVVSASGLSLAVWLLIDPLTYS